MRKMMQLCMMSSRFSSSCLDTLPKGKNCGSSDKYCISISISYGVLWNCQAEVVNLTEIIFMIKTNLDGMGCVLNEIHIALKVQGLFFTWSPKFSYQQVYSACICHPSICTQRLAFQQFLVKVFIVSIQLVNLDIDKPMLRPSLSSYWGPV